MADQYVSVMELFNPNVPVQVLFPAGPSNYDTPKKSKQEGGNPYYIVDTIIGGIARKWCIDEHLHDNLRGRGLAANTQFFLMREKIGKAPNVWKVQAGEGWDTIPWPQKAAPAQQAPAPQGAPTTPGLDNPAGQAVHPDPTPQSSPQNAPQQQATPPPAAATPQQQPPVAENGLSITEMGELTREALLSAYAAFESAFPHDQTNTNYKLAWGMEYVQKMATTILIEGCKRNIRAPEAHLHAFRGEVKKIADQFAEMRKQANEPPAG